MAVSFTAIFVLFCNYLVAFTLRCGELYNIPIALLFQLGINALNLKRSVAAKRTLITRKRED